MPVSDRVMEALATTLSCGKANPQNDLQSSAVKQFQPASWDDIVIFYFRSLDDLLRWQTELLGDLHPLRSLTRRASVPSPLSTASACCMYRGTQTPAAQCLLHLQSVSVPPGPLDQTNVSKPCCGHHMSLRRCGSREDGCLGGTASPAKSPSKDNSCVHQHNTYGPVECTHSTHKAAKSAEGAHQGSQKGVRGALLRVNEGAGFFVLRSARNLLEGSTGCHLWPASLWMTQYILCNPHLVRGKHCAELGCGVGLLGVCLDRCGASKVC
jgi:hypothetical protein